MKSRAWVGPVAAALGLGVVALALGGGVPGSNRGRRSPAYGDRHGASMSDARATPHETVSKGPRVIESPTVATVPPGSNALFVPTWLPDGYEIKGISGEYGHDQPHAAPKGFASAIWGRMSAGGGLGASLFVRVQDGPFLPLDDPTPDWQVLSVQGRRAVWSDSFHDLWVKDGTRVWWLEGFSVERAQMVRFAEGMTPPAPNAQTGSISASYLPPGFRLLERTNGAPKDSLRCDTTDGLCSIEVDIGPEGSSGNALWGEVVVIAGHPEPIWDEIWDVGTYGSTIRGHDAFIREFGGGADLYDRYAAEIWWKETPTIVIDVLGHFPTSDVRRMAESLREVSRFEMERLNAMDEAYGCVEGMPARYGVVDRSSTHPC